MRCSLQLASFILFSTLTLPILSSPIPQAQSITEAEQSSGINDIQDNLKNQSSSSITTGSLVDRQAQTLRQALESSGINKQNEKIHNQTTNNVETGGLVTRSTPSDTSSDSEASTSTSSSSDPSLSERQAQTLSQTLQSTGINAINAKQNGTNHNIPQDSLPRPSLELRDEASSTTVDEADTQKAGINDGQHEPNGTDSAQVSTTTALSKDPMRVISRMKRFIA